MEADGSGEQGQAACGVPGRNKQKRGLAQSGYSGPALRCKAGGRTGTSPPQLTHHALARPPVSQLGGAEVAGPALAAPHRPALVGRREEGGRDGGGPLLCFCPSPKRCPSTAHSPVTPTAMARAVTIRAKERMVGRSKRGVEEGERVEKER